MNFKKGLLILIFSVAFLAIALGISTFLPQDAVACAIFFGGLALTMLIGVLLVIPFCLLLVKYFKK